MYTSLTFMFRIPLLPVLTNGTCTASNTALPRKEILFILTVISKQILLILTPVTYFDLLSYYQANLLKFKNVKLYKYKKKSCVSFMGMRT
jgi:hypothetical protein